MRAEFTIKPHPLGERLVWRSPAADAANERRLLAALAPHGQTSIPRTITIGYYLASAGDHTPPAFRPALTPTALAALSLRPVQERIATDLTTRAARLIQFTPSAAHSYSDFCAHYSLDPKSDNAREQYQRYLDAGDAFDTLLTNPRT